MAKLTCSLNLKMILLSTVGIRVDTWMFYVLSLFLKNWNLVAKLETQWLHQLGGLMTCQLLIAHMETSSKLSWWSWLFSWLLYFCLVLQKCFDLLRLIFVFLLQFKKCFKENFLCPPKICFLLMWVLGEEDPMYYKTWMNLYCFTIHCNFSSLKCSFSF